MADRSDPITTIHIKKVAELICEKWQRLGAELGISNNRLKSLATPDTGGRPQYAARMLNTWYEENCKMSVDQVRKALEDALKECGRNDVAAKVESKLKTENDIEKVFSGISEMLTEDWEDVGCYLNISVDTRRAARAHPGLPHNPRLEMLEFWRKETATKDQRNQLITALKELKREDIIKAIEEVDEKTRPGAPRESSSLFAQTSQHDHQDSMAQAVDGGQNPPPSKLNVDGNSSLSGEASIEEEVNDVTMLHDLPSRSKHTSATLNPKFEWMGSEFRRLRNVCTQNAQYDIVIIALLDSGVNTDHPDLKGLIVESNNCIGRESDGNFSPIQEEEKDLTRDDLNHGTVSAGILWQYAGNKNVKILNLKVLRKNNSGNLMYVSRALAYIKDWDAKNPTMQVDIIVMTLGHPIANDELDRHLAELGEKKVNNAFMNVLVCSAANEGQMRANSILSPAKHGSVIAVGSCNHTGTRCDHSAVGAELAFLFPGKDVCSTSSKFTSDKSTHYITQDGTSFAAPHCAALVAVILLFIEKELDGLDRKSGKHWRKVLTKSSRMKELIQDFCHREHSYDRGYGAPELQLITKNRIEDFIRRTFNVQ